MFVPCGRSAILATEFRTRSEARACSRSCPIGSRAPRRKCTRSRPGWGCAGNGVERPSLSSLFFLFAQACRVSSAPSFAAGGGTWNLAQACRSGFRGPSQPGIADGEAPSRRLCRAGLPPSSKGLLHAGATPRVGVERPSVRRRGPCSASPPSRAPSRFSDQHALVHSAHGVGARAESRPAVARVTGGLAQARTVRSGILRRSMCRVGHGRRHAGKGESPGRTGVAGAPVANRRRSAARRLESGGPVQQRHVGAFALPRFSALRCGALTRNSQRNRRNGQALATGAAARAGPGHPRRERIGSDLHEGATAGAVARHWAKAGS